MHPGPDRYAKIENSSSTKEIPSMQVSHLRSLVEQTFLKSPSRYPEAITG